jgi:hypothetical protein
MNAEGRKEQIPAWCAYVRDVWLAAAAEAGKCELQAQDL